MWVHASECEIQKSTLSVVLILSVKISYCCQLQAINKKWPGKKLTDTDTFSSVLLNGTGQKGIHNYTLPSSQLACLVLPTQMSLSPKSQPRSWDSNFIKHWLNIKPPSTSLAMFSLETQWVRRSLTPLYFSLPLCSLTYAFNLFIVLVCKNLSILSLH